MTRAERMKQKMQIPAEPEQLDGQMSLDDIDEDFDPETGEILTESKVTEFERRAK